MPTPSVVYTMHDSDAIKDYRTNPSIVRAMVNRLVLAATGQPDVAKAWASLVSPTDKIGIKISAAGGELFTTHYSVVNAIVDGLVAQYAGGPQSQPNYAVHHATLYASKDPVALDAIALKRLEQWRVRASLPAIGHTADYVGFASALGLGNAAANRIEIKNIGR